MQVKCAQCNALVINGKATHETGCHGTLEFIGPRNRVFNYFQFIAYDTWGNAKDGYEVNDILSKTKVGLIPKDAGDTRVLQELKTAGLISKYSRTNSFEFDWQDEGTCEISFAKTGEPIGRLEAI